MPVKKKKKKKTAVDPFFAHCFDSLKVNHLDIIRRLLVMLDILFMIRETAEIKSLCEMLLEVGESRNSQKSSYHFLYYL